MKSAISAAVILSFIVTTESSLAQDKKEATFKRVNPFPKGKYAGLHHGTLAPMTCGD